MTIASPNDPERRPLPWDGNARPRPDDPCPEGQLEVGIDLHRTFREPRAAQRVGASDHAGA